MNKDNIKNITDFIPDISEDDPLPDEIEAITESQKDTSPTVPFCCINWD